MSERCEFCGGAMVGDGYTSPHHCENVDVPMDTEPDANPPPCPEELRRRLSPKDRGAVDAIVDVLKLSDDIQALWTALTACLEAEGVELPSAQECKVTIPTFDEAAFTAFVESAEIREYTEQEAKRAWANLPSTIKYCDDLYAELTKINTQVEGVRAAMQGYTVILHYPVKFGSVEVVTFVEWADADTAQEAVEHVQKLASEANGGKIPPNEFRCLYVLNGRIIPAFEGDEL